MALALAIDRNDLNERQAEFVKQIMTGVAPTLAAAASGYAEASSTYLLSQPQIAAALHQAVQQALRADAPVNLQVLRKIRDDDKAPAGVRSDIAVKLLRFAGHIEPTKAGDGQPQKTLSEMTTDELRDYRAANQIEIERLESELASRAKVISAPVSAPSKPKRDAKSQSFLE